MWETDPSGNPFLCFFDVPAAIWAQSKGFKVQFNGGPAVVLNNFPRELPTGSGLCVVSGSLFVGEKGRYYLFSHGGEKIQWRVGGRPVRRSVEMKEGYFPIKIIWDKQAGENSLNLEMIGDNGVHIPLDANHATPLEVPQQGEKLELKD
jgi:hypothetical protein